MTVDGQVRATDSHSMAHNFPSDIDLSLKVFPLPQQVHERYLVEEIQPVKEPGFLMKLFIDHSQDFFARNGHMGIVDTHKKPIGGGLHFSERKRFLKDRVFVLEDAAGKPLALTIEEGKTDYVNACLICGMKPLVDETPDNKTLKEGDEVFYPWFRCVDDHPAYTSIDYFDGADYKPFLRAHPDKAEHAVGLLIQSASGHHTLGHLVKIRRGDKHGWDVTIAPGVDPGMMICITAAMEDLFGGKHRVF